MAIPFKRLPIGAHFRFHDGVSSFTSVSKKVSSRCYVWTARKAVMIKLPRNWNTYRMRAGILKTCVGSTRVLVDPTGRTSPLKRRRGIRRGPAQLAGYSRKNRRVRRTRRAGKRS